MGLPTKAKKTRKPVDCVAHLKCYEKHQGKLLKLVSKLAWSHDEHVKCRVKHQEKMLKLAWGHDAHVKVWHFNFWRHWSFDRFEIAAVANIEPSLLKKEASLFKVKWFDYRGIHPAEATYLFAVEYDRIYRRSMSVRVDYRDGWFHAAFKSGDVLAGREGTALWKARSAADAMGVRYDFFIQTIIDRADDTSWANIPRPAQMYSEEMIAFVAERWERECRGRLQFAQQPEFLAENYVGSAAQNAYQKFMVQQIRKRRFLEFGIFSYMVQKRQLLEKVAMGIGSGLVEKARAIQL